MTRQSISITDPNDKWLKAQIETQEFSSKSEAVNALIRQARKADEYNQYVNAKLRAAAQGPLEGILGFENRPLVSADYTNDTRSGIVDGPSTMVVDDRLVKVLIWYDNEYGYAFRMAELAAKVAAAL